MNQTPSSLSTPPATIELHNGPMRLALRADLGGSIAGLWHHDLPVMRSVEPHALAGPRQGGSFPLVPYSNRLGYMRFRWAGRDHTTQPNFPGPHSLHGVGWQRAWSLLTHHEHDAALGYQHEGDAHWPFAFECTQRFVLTPAALELRLEVVNRAAEPAPMGLGWHPYFPKRSRSRLHIEITERWNSDTAELPTRRVDQPGIDADVAHLEFDNCFEGWRGAAHIRDEKLSLKLTSSLDRLVVYTPQSKDYFCVEPVSHVSNAIHMSDPAAHGLRTLQPGEAMQAWMKLDVTVL
ncbi:MAG TPA: aldose 1-epimerase [Burkholderiaceae bacterium]|nr:aldose 1-epimerase [Burkholderiaceae bacterium]